MGWGIITTGKGSYYTDMLKELRYADDSKFMRIYDGNQVMKPLTTRVMTANLFTIKKVIFNPPATVVFWEDGTKTVVKCKDGDTFDQEKGLAMAFAKRALGDKGNYYNVFKKHCKTEEPLKWEYKRKNIIGKVTSIQEEDEWAYCDCDLSVHDCKSCIYWHTSPYEVPCNDCTHNLVAKEGASGNYYASKL